jgi:hypothetical protein
MESIKSDLIATLKAARLEQSPPKRIWCRERHVAEWESRGYRLVGYCEGVPEMELVDGNGTFRQ